MKNKTNKVGFNLYRKAMGWDWMSFRPEYQWFTLENIISGQDSGWNKLVSKNPSLAKVVHHIKAEYDKKVSTFTERYSVSEEQIQDFYNMYVGYHPAYGAYMVGVGPYVGNKPEDEENKFGQFTMRYPSTDSRNLKTLWAKFLNGHTSYKSIANDLGVAHLSSVVDPDDFLMQVRQKTGEQRGSTQSEGEDFELIDMTPEFLAQNDYQKAIEEGREPPNRTVMGVGSYFYIKPKGVFKLLLAMANRHGQMDQLKGTILEVAKRRGIPEDQIMEASQADQGFAKEVSEMFENINPLANGIMNPKRSGSQQTEALKPSREQTQMMKLMKEICETVVEKNSEDPAVIAEALNSRRPKQKGKAQGIFTPEIMSHWLEQVKFFRQSHDENGNVISEKGYDEMAQEFSGNIEDLRRGFDDMETALKMATMRFAEAQSEEVDPISRAKLIMIPSMFEMPASVNMTSMDLTKMRSGEGITPIVQEDVIEETPIDQTQEKGLEDIDIVKHQVKTPPKEVVLEEDEVVLDEEEVLARTLKTLIKIAQDLRSRRQGKAAWGIERVIRKYQRKI